MCDACGKVMRSNTCSPRGPTAECAGTIVVLIDESKEMATPIAGGTKSKAESVATAVNSMLNQLTTGRNVRLVIVGYGGASRGSPSAQLRWTGPLAGRVAVNSMELSAAPALVEKRIRRIPGPGGVGAAREETILFPIWYVPQLSAGGGIEEAAGFVIRTLAEAGDDSSGKRPVVLHLCGNVPAAMALQAESVRTALETSFWYHLHLGTNDRIPATTYPSSNRHLANSDVAALFEASSELGEPMAAALRAANVAVSPSARGMVHQASMGDLIRFLALARAYVEAAPEVCGPTRAGRATVSIAAVETTVDPAATALSLQPPSLPTYERVALIFLADRSQADPTCGVWRRRQEQINEMIGRIARRAGGDVEVGLTVYGGGTIEVGFQGPLEGRTTVPDVDLSDGALRVEKVTEKMSNGVGGLVEVKCSRPIFIDREASGPAQDLESVMPALSELIDHIRELHEDGKVLPLVMHVTGAGFLPEAIAAATARLGDLGHVLVYHAVVSESPLTSVAYPSDADELTDPAVAALWQMASPLAGADRIAAKRRNVTRASRGLVVAAKFDLLLESIQTILGKEH